MGKPSRRQWLLGLIGAVFGTSAARAVDRWLPGSRKRTGEPNLLVTLQSTTNTTKTRFMEPEGKLEVGSGTQPGSFLITIKDARGQIVDTFDTPLMRLTLSQREVPYFSSNSHVFTYDGSRLDRYDACGSVMTLVYDARGSADSEGTA